MNVTKEMVGNLHAVLNVQLTPEDYQQRVAQGLKGYKKSAKLPGFRPGHVPDGIVKKMYGKYVLMDEVGKATSEGLSKYIADEKIQLLGDPIPQENTEELDWNEGASYNFSFEIGIAPEMNVDLTKDDHFTVYDIQPDQEMEDSYIRNYARRFGQFVSRETIADLDEMIKGTCAELNEDQTPREGGLLKENASIYLEFLKDEASKQLFKGCKCGDVVKLNMPQAFPNEVEISSMLGIDKAKVKDLQPWFSYKVESIAKFENAAIDQNLFDKVYGEGQVQSEEDFRARIQSEIKTHLAEDASYKFRVDVRKALLEKVQMELPAEFLKKWMKRQAKDEKTASSVDEDYDNFARDLKWQLIVNQIIKSQKIEIKEDDVIIYAQDAARRQFAQYGMLNVPDEQIVGYARNMLQNENESRRIVEQLYEDRALGYVKEAATQDVVSISMDDYRKMLADNQPQD